MYVHYSGSVTVFIVKVYISGGVWSLMGSQGMPLLINYIVHDDTKNEMIFILQPILQSPHHIFDL